VDEVSGVALDELAGGGGHVTLEATVLLIFFICAKAGSAVKLDSARKNTGIVNKLRINKYLNINNA
jgi:hypothetical protein